MDVQDKIIFFLKNGGPTIPSKAAKHINTNILFASAHLSDLVSQGKVLVSSLKIGGSPLYYLSGQEDQLYNFALGNLNSKDMKVLDKLKEKKVLRESNLDLLSKVSLRSLKDFAVPLKVNFYGNVELFWKWHLLPQEETNEAIKDHLEGSNKTKEKKLELQEESKPKEELVPIQEKETEEESEEPEKEEEKEDFQEVQKTLVDNKKSGIKKKKSGRPPKKSYDELLLKVEKFFRKMDITIDEHKIIRRDAELDLFVKVPSVVGDIAYFCKAKSKLKCDERDISSAYMESQMKKVPLLFIYSGELTKKAKFMLESKAFENAIIKKMN